MVRAKERAKFHQMLTVAFRQTNLDLSVSAAEDRAVCEQEPNPVRRIGSQFVECIVAQLVFLGSFLRAMQDDVMTVKQVVDRSTPKPESV